MRIAICNLVVDTRSITELYHNLISLVVSLEFGAVRVCPRHAKTLPLSLTHMPTGPSPLQELATGIRRMLTPPAPTQHHTPDQSGESRSSPAQLAGVHTDVPVDASAAAPGRRLQPLNEPRSALPASTTTPAALQDPPPGLRPPSPASVTAPVNASAHDPQPFTLANTSYVP